MISSFKIEGYRGFKKFEMDSLGAVNLLVGTNNSGKTSILEALYLLATCGEPSSFWQLLARRGERSIAADSRSGTDLELDVTHLFTGHEVNLGTKFSLVARNQSPERSLVVSVGKMPARSERGEPDPAAPARLALHLTGNPSPTVPFIPITRFGGISADSLDFRRLPGSRRAVAAARAIEIEPSQFITTASVDGDELTVLWNKVALTPDENLVLRALQFLDSKIERIAAQSYSGGPYFYMTGSRSGFIVKQSDRDQPIPIGSMGDGIWRLLAMAISITRCRGGVLLVDEIDTGLHHTVMADMWRLVLGAARDLGVQVFATTHSRDCVESLAVACSSTPFGTPVTLQRIEAGKQRSVPYSENEILTAAERGMEVR